MFKANLGADLGGGFFSGLEGQYVSRRLTAEGSRHVGGYSLFNLNVRYVPSGRRWEMALGFYNLFDVRFSDPVATDLTVAGPRWSIPQIGRTALLTTTLFF